MNRAEQAVRHLDVTVDRGLVRVTDGVDLWICRESDWRAAMAKLAQLPASDGEPSEAYQDLCDETRGLDMVSMIGDCSGEWRSLVAEAQSSGIIDEREAEHFARRGVVAIRTST